MVSQRISDAFDELWQCIPREIFEIKTYYLEIHADSTWLLDSMNNSFQFASNEELPGFKIARNVS